MLFQLGGSLELILCIHAEVYFLYPPYQNFSPLLPFSLSNFLQGGSQVDGERTGTDDTGERSRPVQQVTFVLVAVRLEFFR